MNCSLCGEVCRCPSEPVPDALKQCDPEAESSAAVAAAPDALIQDDQSRGVQTEDAPAWRDELHARLSRYRARRRVRPPRYPSLRLQFEELDWSTRAHATGESAPVPTFESVSNHALALDEMRQRPCADATEVESPAAEAAPPMHPAGHFAGQLSGNSPGHYSGASAGAKI